MAAPKPWIKLWIEILLDPKMGRLSDRLWRRAVECFLLAGQNHQAGLLPSIQDCAYVLHVSAEEVESDFIELQRAGLLNGSMDQWRVVNFEERQRPRTDAERSRSYRQNHGSVTEPSQDHHENRHGGEESRGEESRAEENRGEDKIAMMLAGEGVSQDKARELTEEHSAEHVLEKLDYYRFGRDHGTIENAGWLVEALEHDYGPPREYVPLDKRCAECGKSVSRRNDQCETHRLRAYQGDNFFDE